jgi:hypothetical protein
LSGDDSFLLVYLLPSLWQLTILEETF